MRKIVSVVIILGLLIVLQASSYAAPLVDGFIGIPWGASRQQIQKSMEERGFLLLEQRADGVVDTYRGTFTGQPAELKFQYTNNAFFEGEATFLQVKGKGLGDVRAYYRELTGLLTAKYGSPTTEYVGANGVVMSCAWQQLPTTATPPGQVTILTRYGRVFYGTGYLGNGLYDDSGVTVSYSIGSTWARLKTVKDSNDI